MVSDTVAESHHGDEFVGLNPCSNGIWSLTVTTLRLITLIASLNPCSNGIWSLTVGPGGNHMRGRCLNPCSNGIWSLT